MQAKTPGLLCARAEGVIATYERRGRGGYKARIGGLISVCADSVGRKAGVNAPKTYGLPVRSGGGIGSVLFYLMHIGIRR